MKLKIPFKTIILKKKTAFFVFFILVLFLIYIFTKYAALKIESQNNDVENAINNMSGTLETINMFNEKKKLIQYKLDAMHRIDISAVDWPLIIKSVKNHAPSDVKLDTLTFSKDFITIQCKTNNVDSGIIYATDLEKSDLFKEIKITDINAQEKGSEVEFSLCLVLKSKVE